MHSDAMCSLDGWSICTVSTCEVQTARRRRSFALSLYMTVFDISLLDTAAACFCQIHLN